MAYSRRRSHRVVDSAFSRRKRERYAAATSAWLTNLPLARHLTMWCRLGSLDRLVSSLVSERVASCLVLWLRSGIVSAGVLAGEVSWGGSWKT